MVQRITLREIAEHVCRHFGLPLADVLGCRRKRRYLRPRHVIAALARQLTTETLEDIARFLGGRNHTTICNSVNVVRESDELTSVANELSKLILCQVRTICTCPRCGLAIKGIA